MVMGVSRAAVWRVILVSGLAASSLAPRPALAQNPPPAPRTTPPDAKPGSGGSVIKPPAQVDPGIKAKTPSGQHFPMPVINPGPQPPQQTTPR
jgi:hypothetical protein